MTLKVISSWMSTDSTVNWDWCNRTLVFYTSVLWQCRVCDSICTTSKYLQHHKVTSYISRDSWRCIFLILLLGPVSPTRVNSPIYWTQIIWKRQLNQIRVSPSKNELGSRNSFSKLADMKHEFWLALWRSRDLHWLGLVAGNRKIPASYGRPVRPSPSVWRHKRKARCKPCAK